MAPLLQPHVGPDLFYDFLVRMARIYHGLQVDFPIIEETYLQVAVSGDADAVAATAEMVAH